MTDEVFYDFESFQPNQFLVYRTELVNILQLSGLNYLLLQSDQEFEKSYFSHCLFTNATYF